MAKWVPVKLVPDPKVRGWKPKAGWYCFNTKTRTSDVRQRFGSNRAAAKACAVRSSE